MKPIVKSLEWSNILVAQAKVTLQTTGLATQPLKIKNQYEYLAKLIETIESANYTIKEAEQAIHELVFGEDSYSINVTFKKERKTITFPD